MAAAEDSTRGPEYTKRLQRLQDARWKRILDVQRPYRWNLRRLFLGRSLDVGCGIGRNLAFLPEGSLGLDHNEESVRLARASGLQALTVDEFAERRDSLGLFDSLLAAHVVEHMTEADAVDLLRLYLPAVRSGGKIVLITPQQAGYRSDETHVRFVDLAAQQNLLERCELTWDRGYSFPFVPVAGRAFRYNEFVGLATKAD